MSPLPLPALGWFLLCLSLLHSLSSIRNFPSHNVLLALSCLLPPPESLQPTYFSTLGAFTALTIFFDIVWCAVNGPSITGAQAESASSAGTKFSFGVFIVAMLAKVPLGLAAAKMHMQLKEGGGAGGGAGAQAGRGAVMSPAHGKEGGGSSGYAATPSR